MTADFLEAIQRAFDERKSRQTARFIRSGAIETHSARKRTEMNENEKPDAWSNGTWEGSRIEELKRWRALPLKAKLEALDQLRSLGDQLLERRKKAGSPYIDPSTRQLIAKGAEDSSDYNKDPRRKQRVISNCRGDR